MVFTCLYTWYAIKTVYSDPRLRAQVEQLYNYYTGQLSGQAESESNAQSEDPQQILNDILSGKYREGKSGSDAPAIPGNGGALIGHVPFPRSRKIPGRYWPAIICSSLSCWCSPV